MSDDLDTYSPTGALVPLSPADPEWQPILHVSNQVVLYNPTSHALSIRTHSPPPSGPLARHGHARCPYCHRSISPDHGRSREHDSDDDVEESLGRASNRAANYFQLLEIANETSRPASPDNGGSPPRSSTGSAFRAENMAEGYFQAFFQEVCRLGMGANGSVYLCQVSCSSYITFRPFQPLRE